MNGIFGILAQAAEAATEAANDAAAKANEAAAAQSGGGPLDKAIDFLTSDRVIDLGVALLSAIAIFIVGKWVVGVICRVVSKLMTKAKLDDMLISFFHNMVYALLMVFVVLAALERLGVDTTSFAAIIAAAGLAVGFALQGSLSNFAAGVMLIMFKPFKVGDLVEAGGSTGVVEEIQIFNTIMRTGDNIKIIIPNNAITGATITNMSAKETRRVDLTIGCAYDDDIRAVKAYLEEVLSNHDKVLSDPAPAVAIAELGDCSINFNVRPWVKSGDYWPVRAELLETIKLGFDERGFNFPYPTQDIHVHTGGAGSPKEFADSATA